jgi:hypothetical protein
MQGNDRKDWNTFIRSQHTAKIKTKYVACFQTENGSATLLRYSLGSHAAIMHSLIDGIRPWSLWSHTFRRDAFVGRGNDTLSLPPCASFRDSAGRHRQWWRSCSAWAKSIYGNNSFLSQLHVDSHVLPSFPPGGWECWLIFMLRTEHETYLNKRFAKASMQGRRRGFSGQTNQWWWWQTGIQIIWDEMK